jgi:hypothetical protein
MYVSDRWLSWLGTCIWPLTFLAWYMVRYIHVLSQESQPSDTYMYQARKVNRQIHTCTKPGKSTVRYSMYLTVDFPGLVHVCIWPLTFLAWYMYLTVDLPGLIHVCIWPLTFLAWYMYVSDRWLSWLGTCMYLTVGKSAVRYIHVLSQQSLRSDTYMY